MKLRILEVFCNLSWFLQSGSRPGAWSVGWGPIRDPVRAVQTQIYYYVGVFGVRQQTRYLGLLILACPGESIGRWPDTKKSFPCTPEVTLEVFATDLSTKEKLA